jgi:hypothetical protein
VKPRRRRAPTAQRVFAVLALLVIISMVLSTIFVPSLPTP